MIQGLTLLGALAILASSIALEVQIRKLSREVEALRQGLEEAGGPE